MPCTRAFFSLPMDYTILMDLVTVRRIAFLALGLLLCGMAVQSYLHSAFGSEATFNGVLGVILLILAATSKGG
jgi:hypothetical protein